jgi:YD repeat-containing protein
LIKRTGPGADDRIRFFYDGESRLSIIDFPRGSDNDLSLLLRYKYDAANRLEVIERQLGSTGPVIEQTRFEYNDERVDFKEIEVMGLTQEKQRVDFVYDAAGHLVLEQPEFGSVVSYVYVEDGVLRHKDTSARRTIYEFDDFGNVLSETVVSSHDETEIKQQWLYEYSCWDDKSAAERNAPRVETPYLSATVR